MTRIAQKAAALAAAATLALPGAALAQSAGDEQYRDPFGGDVPEQQPQGGGGSQGGGESQPAPAQPAPQSAQLPQTEAPVAETAQTTTDPDALPRTGAPLALLAGAGLALAAGGAALRRRL